MVKQNGTLEDQFGRPMKSLRLSVTDRCNLACSYCMPEDGPEHLSPKEEILSFEELAYLTECFVEMGVTNVRVTGGEPLLRKELHKLIGLLKGIDGLEEISLTTNGYYLKDYLKQLKNAGLDRINFSLDTLRKDRFEQITRRKGFEKVMQGLDALLDTPSLHPVKLNVVAMKNINDDELVDFARWAYEQGQQVRFIEYMPLEGGYDWSIEKMIPAREIQALIEDEFSLAPINKRNHSPSTDYTINGSTAVVGFIPSVTNPFCSSCDRVRLTADGNVMNCLFAYEEDDLRTALREGRSKSTIKDLIRDNYVKKWEGGCVKLFKGEYKPDQISRTMSRIGG